MSKGESSSDNFSQISQVDDSYYDDENYSPEEAAYVGATRLNKRRRYYGMSDQSLTEMISDTRNRIEKARDEAETLKANSSNSMGWAALPGILALLLFPIAPFLGLMLAIPAVIMVSQAMESSDRARRKDNYANTLEADLRDMKNALGTEQKPQASRNNLPEKAPEKITEKEKAKTKTPKRKSESRANNSEPTTTTTSNSVTNNTTREVKTDNGQDPSDLGIKLAGMLAEFLKNLRTKSAEPTAVPPAAASTPGSNTTTNTTNVTRNHPAGGGVSSDAGRVASSQTQSDKSTLQIAADRIKDLHSRSLDTKEGVDQGTESSTDDFDIEGVTIDKSSTDLELVETTNGNKLTLNNRDSNNLQQIQAELIEAQISVVTIQNLADLVEEKQDIVEELEAKLQEPNNIKLLEAEKSVDQAVYDFLDFIVKTEDNIVTVDGQKIILSAPLIAAQGQFTVDPQTALAALSICHAAMQDSAKKTSTTIKEIDPDKRLVTFQPATQPATLNVVNFFLDSQVKIEVEFPSQKLVLNQTVQRAIAGTIRRMMLEASLATEAGRMASIPSITVSEIDDNDTNTKLSLQALANKVNSSAEKVVGPNNDSLALVPFQPKLNTNQVEFSQALKVLVQTVQERSNSLISDPKSKTRILISPELFQRLLEMYTASQNNGELNWVIANAEEIDENGKTLNSNDKNDKQVAVYKPDIGQFAFSAALPLHTTTFKNGNFSQILTSHIAVGKSLLCSVNGENFTLSQKSLLAIAGMLGITQPNRPLSIEDVKPIKADAISASVVDNNVERGEFKSNVGDHDAIDHDILKLHNGINNPEIRISDAEEEVDYPDDFEPEDEEIPEIIEIEDDDDGLGESRESSPVPTRNQDKDENDGYQEIIGTDEDDDGFEDEDLDEEDFTPKEEVNEKRQQALELAAEFNRINQQLNQLLEYSEFRVEEVEEEILYAGRTKIIFEENEDAKQEEEITQFSLEPKIGANGKSTDSVHLELLKDSLRDSFTLEDNQEYSAKNSRLDIKLAQVNYSCGLLKSLAVYTEEIKKEEVAEVVKGTVDNLIKYATDLKDKAQEENAIYIQDKESKNTLYIAKLIEAEISKIAKLDVDFWLEDKNLTFEELSNALNESLNELKVFDEMLLENAKSEQATANNIIEGFGADNNLKEPLSASSSEFSNDLGNIEPDGEDYTPAIYPFEQSSELSKRYQKCSDIKKFVEECILPATGYRLRKNNEEVVLVADRIIINEDTLESVDVTQLMEEDDVDLVLREEILVLTKQKDDDDNLAKFRENCLYNLGELEEGDIKRIKSTLNYNLAEYLIDSATVMDKEKDESIDTLLFDIQYVLSTYAKSSSKVISEQDIQDEISDIFKSEKSNSEKLLDFKNILLVIDFSNREAQTDQAKDNNKNEGFGPDDNNLAPITIESIKGEYQQAETYPSSAQEKQATLIYDNIDSGLEEETQYLDTNPVPVTGGYTDVAPTDIQYLDVNNNCDLTHIEDINRMVDDLLNQKLYSFGIQDIHEMSVFIENDIRDYLQSPTDRDAENMLELLSESLFSVDQGHEYLDGDKDNKKYEVNNDDKMNAVSETDNIASLSAYHKKYIEEYKEILNNFSQGNIKLVGEEIVGDNYTLKLETNKTDSDLLKKFKDECRDGDGFEELNEYKLSSQEILNIININFVKTLWNDIKGLNIEGSKDYIVGSKDEFIPSIAETLGEILSGSSLEKSGKLDDLKNCKSEEELLTAIYKITNIQSPNLENALESISSMLIYNIEKKLEEELEEDDELSENNDRFEVISSVSNPHFVESDIKERWLSQARQYREEFKAKTRDLLGDYKEVDGLYQDIDSDQYKDIDPDLDSSVEQQPYKNKELFLDLRGVLEQHSDIEEESGINQEDKTTYLRDKHFTFTKNINELEESKEGKNEDQSSFVDLDILKLASSYINNIYEEFRNSDSLNWNELKLICTIYEEIREIQKEKISSFNEKYGYQLSDSLDIEELLPELKVKKSDDENKEFSYYKESIFKFINREQEQFRNIEEILENKAGQEKAKEYKITQENNPVSTIVEEDNTIYGLDPEKLNELKAGIKKEEEDLRIREEAHKIRLKEHEKTYEKISTKLESPRAHSANGEDLNIS